MSQYEIAKRLGVSEAAVSKWYSGKTLPNGTNLVALASLLDKKPEELLRELSKKMARRS